MLYFKLTRCLISRGSPTLPARLRPEGRGGDLDGRTIRPNLNIAVGESPEHSCQPSNVRVGLTDGNQPACSSLNPRLGLPHTIGILPVRACNAECAVVSALSRAPLLKPTHTSKRAFRAAG